MAENEGNPIIDPRFLGDVPTSRVDRYGRLPLYLGPGQTVRGDGVGDLPAFTGDTPNVGDTLVWNGAAYVPQAPAKGATIYANIVDSSLVNTAGETDFDIDHALPANALNALGTTIRAKIYGQLMGAFSAANLTLRLKLGTDTLFTCTTIAGLSGATAYYSVDFLCVIRAVGGSGSINTIQTAGVFNNKNPINMKAPSAVTIDTAAAATLKVSADLSSGAPSSTRLYSVTAEVIGPAA